MTNSDTGYYRKKGSELEYVDIKLIDEDGEEFDMEHLRNIFKETIENQKEKLEKIVDFGTAILGEHHKGVSFMFGWVVQKIINAYENKNDVKLKVVTDAQRIDNDEIKTKTIDLLEELLEKVKSDDFDISDLPLNMSNVDYD